MNYPPPRHIDVNHKISPDGGGFSQKTNSGGGGANNIMHQPAAATARQASNNFSSAAGHSSSSRIATTATVVSSYHQHQQHMSKLSPEYLMTAPYPPSPSPNPNNGLSNSPPPSCSSYLPPPPPQHSNSPNSLSPSAAATQPLFVVGSSGGQSSLIRSAGVEEGNSEALRYQITGAGYRVPNTALSSKDSTGPYRSYHYSSNSLSPSPQPPIQQFANNNMKAVPSTYYTAGVNAVTPQSVSTKQLGNTMMDPQHQPVSSSSAAVNLQSLQMNLHHHQQQGSNSQPQQRSHSSNGSAQQQQMYSRQLSAQRQQMTSGNYPWCPQQPASKLNPGSNTLLPPQAQVVVTKQPQGSLAASPHGNTHRTAAAAAPPPPVLFGHQQHLGHHHPPTSTISNNNNGGGGGSNNFSPEATDGGHLQQLLRPPSPIIIQQFRDNCGVIVSERDPLNPSKILHQYKCGKLLGTGGFAKVFEFEHLRTGKLYACKIVDKAKLKDEKKRRKLLFEIELHQMMNHKNILHFFRYFQDEHYYFLLLELCLPQSLMDLSKSHGVFSVPETQFILQQLLEATHYLHSAHCVIHRDLKLGNIMLKLVTSSHQQSHHQSSTSPSQQHDDEDTCMQLSPDLLLKVGDFGLAAQLQFDGERKRTMCGTPNYIAPEILADSEGYSYSADIWSLGVIIYTLLVGTPPFETADLTTTYRLIRNAKYTYPPQVKVPAVARNLIGKILQCQPDKRPSLFDIRKDDFFKQSSAPLRGMSSSSSSLSPVHSLFVHLGLHDQKAMEELFWKMQRAAVSVYEEKQLQREKQQKQQGTTTSTSVPRYPTPTSGGVHYPNDKEHPVEMQPVQSSDAPTGQENPVVIMKSRFHYDPQAHDEGRGDQLPHHVFDAVPVRSEDHGLEPSETYKAAEKNTNSYSSNNNHHFSSPPIQQHHRSPLVATQRNNNSIKESNVLTTSSNPGNGQPHPLHQQQNNNKCSIPLTQAGSLQHGPGPGYQHPTGTGHPLNYHGNSVLQRCPASTRALANQSPPPIPSSIVPVPMIAAATPVPKVIPTTTTTTPSPARDQHHVLISNIGHPDEDQENHEDGSHHPTKTMPSSSSPTTTHPLISPSYSGGGSPPQQQQISSHKITSQKVGTPSPKIPTTGINPSNPIVLTTAASTSSKKNSVDQKANPEIEKEKKKVNSNNNHEGVLFRHNEPLQPWRREMQNYSSSSSSSYSKTTPPAVSSSLHLDQVSLSLQETKESSISKKNLLEQPPAGIVPATHPTSSSSTSTSTKNRTQEKGSNVAPPSSIVCVTQIIDYSRKYGFGFQLSDGNQCFLFNDNSKMLFQSREMKALYMDKTGSQPDGALHDRKKTQEQVDVELEQHRTILEINLSAQPILSPEGGGGIEIEEKWGRRGAHQQKNISAVGVSESAVFYLRNHQQHLLADADVNLRSHHNPHSPLSHVKTFQGNNKNKSKSNFVDEFLPSSLNNGVFANSNYHDQQTLQNNTTNSSSINKNRISNGSDDNSSFLYHPLHTIEIPNDENVIGTLIQRISPEYSTSSSSVTSPSSLFPFGNNPDDKAKYLHVLHKKLTLAALFSQYLSKKCVNKELTGMLDFFFPNKVMPSIRTATVAAKKEEGEMQRKKQQQSQIVVQSVHGIRYLPLCDKRRKRKEIKQQPMAMSVFDRGLLVAVNDPTSVTPAAQLTKTSQPTTLHLSSKAWHCQDEVISVIRFSNGVRGGRGGAQIHIPRTSLKELLLLEHQQPHRSQRGRHSSFEQSLQALLVGDEEDTKKKGGSNPQTAEEEYLQSSAEEALGDLTIYMTDYLQFLQDREWERRKQKWNAAGENTTSTRRCQKSNGSINNCKEVVFYCFSPSYFSFSGISDELMLLSSSVVEDTTSRNEKFQRKKNASEKHQLKFSPVYPPQNSNDKEIIVDRKFEHHGEENESSCVTISASSCSTSHSTPDDSQFLLTEQVICLVEKVLAETTSATVMAALMES